MRPDSVLNRKVSLYNEILKTNQSRQIELRQLLTDIKSDTYKNRITDLRQGFDIDKETYTTAKKSLPAFTMSALCKHRKAGTPTAEKLIYHTGIMQVDIDSIDPDKLPEYKKIVESDTHTVFCFLSVSGQGIKAAIRTENAPEDHKAAFLSVQNYYRQTYSIEIDPSTKDLFRLCFISYDPDTFINEDPDVLDIRKHAPPPPERQPVTVPRQTALSPTHKQRQTEQGINSAIQILNNSSPGNRHASRIKAGFLIGGYIAGGLITENEAINSLYQSIMANTTLSEPQAIKDVLDGIKAGQVKPISPEQLQAENEDWRQRTGRSNVTCYNGRSKTVTQAVTTSQTKPDPPIEALRTRYKQTEYDQTEIGNSERFSDKYRCKCLHNFTEKEWYIWTGKIWRPDNKGKVTDRAKKLIKQMKKEAYSLPDEEQKNFLKWVNLSSKQRSITAMLELAKSDLPVENHNLNSDPYKLTCQNVTVNLKTLETYKPHPNDLITNQIGVNYDPAAKCPAWDRFLTTVFQNDQELINYVQKLIGYCLTGNTDDQAFYILYGTGSNGKSTFIQVIKQLLGSYFHTAPDHSFLVSHGRVEDSPDVVKWQGKRIVTTEETEDGRRLNLSLIKRVSGSDEVSARQLYQNTVNFTPECKLFLITNHRPKIKSQVYAIWRRVRLIPFLYQIPDQDKIDPAALQKTFRNELSGIFNWALEGLKLYYSEKLTELPAAVKIATEDYKDSEDTLKEFLEDQTETDDMAEETTANLYNAYKQHTEEQNQKPVGSKTFTQLLSDKGYKKGHNSAKTKRVFFGLKLKSNINQTY